MAKAIASAYLATPDGSILDVAATLALEAAGAHIAAQLGSDFFQEILQELLGELGFSSTLTIIPILGSLQRERLRLDTRSRLDLSACEGPW